MNVAHSPPITLVTILTRCQEDWNDAYFHLHYQDCYWPALLRCPPSSNLNLLGSPLRLAAATSLRWRHDEQAMNTACWGVTVRQRHAGVICMHDIANRTIRGAPLPCRLNRGSVHHPAAGSQGPWATNEWFPPSVVSLVREARCVVVMASLWWCTKL